MYLKNDPEERINIAVRKSDKTHPYEKENVTFKAKMDSFGQRHNLRKHLFKDIKIVLQHFNLFEFFFTSFFLFLVFRFTLGEFLSCGNYGQ